MNWHLIAGLTILLSMFGILAIGSVRGTKKEQKRKNKIMDDMMRNQ